MTPACPKVTSRSSDSLAVRRLGDCELQGMQEHPTVVVKKGRRACPSSLLRPEGFANPGCPKTISRSSDS